MGRLQRGRQGGGEARPARGAHGAAIPKCALRTPPTPGRRLAASPTPPGRCRAETSEQSLSEPLPAVRVAQKPELKPERVEAQKAVDAKLMAAVKKTPMMDSYLKALFSLSKGDVPHKMKF